jgi:hypothetical protein
MLRHSVIDFRLFEGNWYFYLKSLETRSAGPQSSENLESRRFDIRRIYRTHTYNDNL